MNEIPQNVLQLEMELDYLLKISALQEKIIELYQQKYQVDAP